MRAGCALLAIVALCGCGDDDANGSGATVTVHPGQSIQAAIEAAPPNAKIFIEPGIYRDSTTRSTAVTISKDGIQLIAHSTADHPVILESAAGQQNGIWVSPADSVDNAEGEDPPCGENGHLVHDFVLTGVTVRGFGQYGVYLACVDGFTLSKNVSDGNQLYGLFPVRSHHGTMSDNEAQGTPLDSALYVGQSDHVTITGNRAHDNVQGLEIENSSDITATGNELFNNTAGLIADIMPGLQKTDQTNVLIAGNHVHDNNRPNTVGEGQGTSDTPQGTGVVILGGAAVTAQDNTVVNNGFAGIIVSGFCSGPSSDAQSCSNLDIDPDPEGNRIVNNTLTNNGKSPPADPLLSQLAADLIWDKSGMGNCWSGNTSTATVKILGGGRTLPACP